MAFILHRGIIQYAVRRAFLFQAQDLEQQYPEVRPTAGKTPVQHFEETLQLFSHLMHICKQSMMIHIVNFLGEDLHNLNQTSVGHALSARFHSALMQLGNQYFNPPWGRKWCEMLALADYLSISVGSEVEDEEALMELERALAQSNNTPDYTAAPAA